MSELAQKKCIPCEGGIPPLKGQELNDFYAKLGKNGNNWKLVDEHHIEKEFQFSSFPESMKFANKVADLAEEEGHHPEILIAFKKVRLSLWTHKINGLSESDFIFAAKSDLLAKNF